MLVASPYDPVPWLRYWTAIASPILQLVIAVAVVWLGRRQIQLDRKRQASADAQLVTIAINDRVPGTIQTVVRVFNGTPEAINQVIATVTLEFDDDDPAVVGESPYQIFGPVSLRIGETRTWINPLLLELSDAQLQRYGMFGRTFSLTVRWRDSQRNCWLIINDGHPQMLNRRQRRAAK